MSSESKSKSQNFWNKGFRYLKLKKDKFQNNNDKIQRQRDDKNDKNLTK